MNPVIAMLIGVVVMMVLVICTIAIFNNTAESTLTFEKK